MTRRSWMLIGGMAALALLASNTLENGQSKPAHKAAARVAGTDAHGGQHREIAVSGARGGQAHSAPGGAPAASLSLYVYGSYVDVCGLDATTGCPLYNDGANKPVPATGGMTILDFGAPCFETATLALGTQLFNSQSCTPDIELVLLADAWLRGYGTNPNHSGAPSSILVAGTSNSLTAAVPGNTLTAAQMSAHGQEWFRSVVDPIAGAASGLGIPVAVWGGSDIEQSSDGDWYDGQTTSAWVDAYAAASGASKPCTATRRGLMVNYGDYVPNEPGWSPGAVYHVAWEAAPACPLPQIYFSENANEWQRLNSYAVSIGLQPMQFVGVLSLDTASGSLSAAESWSALTGVTGQQPPYLSIIGEARPAAAEVPDPPRFVTAVPGPRLVTVVWSAPPWDGGSAVTAYTVTAYTGSIPVQVVTVSGSPVAETTIIAGLANGKPYTFYVSATNRVGAGPLSLPSARAAPSGLFPMR